MALNESDMEHAERLLARCHAGDPRTEAEARRQLAQWAARSDSHRRHYEKLVATDRSLDGALESLRQYYPRHIATPQPEPLSAQLRPVRNPGVRWRKWQVGVSACLVLAALGSVLWLSDPVLSRSEFHTALGEHRQVRLADGSAVELNTDTHLRYAQRLRSRNVELLSGEALFAVKADPRKPFHVFSGPARVTVLGTEFAVRQYQDGSLVTVVGGRVGVVPSADQEGVVLTAGRQVRTRAGRIDGDVRQVDAGQATSWRDGRLVLNGLTLREGMAELQRYRAGNIRIRDAKAAQLRLSGSFSLDDPDLLLRTLASSFPVRVRFQADGSVDIASY